MSDEVLPTFTYYADPVGDETFTQSDAICGGCDRARAWIADDSLLYSAAVPDEARFCPWCISDGTAVARYGGTFNDLEADIPAAAELTERTPNFPKWQDWDWPVHCGDAAEYLGQPEGGAIREDEAGLAALLADVSQYSWSRDEAYMADFLDTAGDEHAFYRFRCRVCQAAIVKWDAE